MRVPRLRFTIRRMMVVVAIVGVALAAWLKMVPYWELSKRYRERVVSYEISAQGHVARIALWEALIAGKKKDPNSHSFTVGLMEDQMRTDRIWLAYNRGLIAKYKRVARFPWLPVAPDPPEPE